jgi:hypothetical protein
MHQPVCMAPHGPIHMHDPTHLTCLSQPTCTNVHAPPCVPHSHQLTTLYNVACMHPPVHLNHISQLRCTTHATHSHQPMCVHEPTLTAPHGAAHARPVHLTYISQCGCTTPRSSPASANTCAQPRATSQLVCTIPHDTACKPSMRLTRLTQPACTTPREQRGSVQH